MTAPGGDAAAAFLRRARHEAERYGADPWVFVRELLQNARDAGARCVEIAVDEGGADRPGVRVECRDDGAGMSVEHARQFLFRLYASSKDGAPGQAGRFGVGFWSVLRFSPDRIVVASRPRQGEGWALVLDLEGGRVLEAPPPVERGTTIALERAQGVRPGQLQRRVLDAARQNGRFLRAPDGQPVVVRVDGQPINEEFTLPAPSSRFSRAGLRGVVALGPAAQVELFSHGLRVRSATALEDLVTRGDARGRVAFPRLPDGLAPQALLDSDHLDLLLARSDARDGRALRRLVGTARREMERLLGRQLARYRPLSAGARIAHAVGVAARACARPVPLALLLVAMAAGLVARWVVPGAPTAARPVLATLAPASTRAPARYQDLAASYRGPEIDELSSDGEPPVVALRYEPPSAEPTFAALTFERVTEDGAPVLADQAIPEDVSRVPCTGDCLDVAVAFQTRGGLVRLPIPTGHALAGGGVTLDGAPAPVTMRVGSLPALSFSGPRTGLLQYRTAPARSALLPPLARGPRLPPDLERQARQARRLPLDARPARLIGLVRARVVYDRSTTAAERHRQARGAGVGFLDRTLAIGAGDCDVQNAILLSVLQHARVPSRLAVGFIGEAGGIRPVKHAWVEVQGRDGRWRVADASLPDQGTAPPPARALAAAGPRADRAATGSSTDGRPAANAQPAREAQPAPLALPPPAANDEEAAPPARTALPLEPSRVARTTAALRASWPVPLVVALAALGVVLAAWFWRRRVDRAVSLDATGDAARLVRGVLQNPGAFRDLPAVFERPLVPLANGGVLSLNGILRLARRGRLFVARGPSALADRARARRLAVLDGRSPEGSAAAAALGAIDLDQWDQLLATARTAQPCARANALFRRAGERLAVVVADGVGQAARALDLDPLGGHPIDGHRVMRVIVVDAGATAWRTAQALEARPETRGESVFALLDEVLGHAGVLAVRRARLLALAARAALGSGEA